MCTIQTPAFSLREEMAISGSFTETYSRISESQCMEDCKFGNTNEVISSCQFNGNFGTIWAKTSDDLPYRNPIRVK